MAKADTYVVERGDTLSRIARAHGFGVQRLARLNNLASPNHIRDDRPIRRCRGARGF